MAKGGGGGGRGGGGAGAKYTGLAGRTVGIPAKHTGWRSTVTFSRWQKHGQDRLYMNRRDYGRNGRLRNSASMKGFIDLKTGTVTAPPSTKRMINQAIGG